eukprot:UN0561
MRRPKEKNVWGPAIFSELTFVHALDKAVWAAYRTPSVALYNAQNPKPQRANNALSVAWKFNKVEPGSKLTVAWNKEGCQLKSDGSKGCIVDYSNQTEASRLNFALRQPLSKDDVVSFDFRLRAGFFKTSSSMKCAACGKPCEGNVMARKFTIPMPRCPVPTGTWVFQLPIPEITNMPEMPTYDLNLHVNIMRPTGVAADFTAEAKML